MDPDKNLLPSPTLNGHSALRCVVYPLQCVRLVAQLGDTHNGDPLSSYCELGKVLAPLRNRDALVENMSVPGMRERDYPGLRAQWIDRFFPK